MVFMMLGDDDYELVGTDFPAGVLEFDCTGTMSVITLTPSDDGVNIDTERGEIKSSATGECAASLPHDVVAANVVMKSSEPPNPSCFVALSY